MDYAAFNDFEGGILDGMIYHHGTNDDCNIGGRKHTSFACRTCVDKNTKERRMFLNERTIYYESNRSIESEVKRKNNNHNQRWYSVGNAGL
jgi:hypothetical protein